MVSVTLAKRMKITRELSSQHMLLSHYRISGTRKYMCGRDSHFFLFITEAIKDLQGSVKGMINVKAKTLHVLVLMLGFPL